MDVTIVIVYSMWTLERSVALYYIWLNTYIFMCCHCQISACLFKWPPCLLFKMQPHFKLLLSWCQNGNVLQCHHTWFQKSKPLTTSSCSWYHCFQSLIQMLLIAPPAGEMERCALCFPILTQNSYTNWLQGCYISPASSLCVLLVLKWTFQLLLQCCSSFLDLLLLSLIRSMVDLRNATVKAVRKSDSVSDAGRWERSVFAFTGNWALTALKKNCSI